MISAGDFRNGVTFEMDGQVVSIIEFQHVKPGKGAAFVRTKIRNVITGAVVEKKTQTHTQSNEDPFYYGEAALSSGKKNTGKADDILYSCSP